MREAKDTAMADGGIRRWAAGEEVEQIWRHLPSGMAGWVRAKDGWRIIETNANPIGEDDEGFAKTWEHRAGWYAPGDCARSRAGEACEACLAEAL